MKAFIKNKKYIAPTILSIFSVIFSAGIIQEVLKFNEFSLLEKAIISIFILVLLIVSEVVKVRSIKKVCKGSAMNIAPLLITVIISLVLSISGAFILFEKAGKIEASTVEAANSKELAIRDKYSDKVNSLIKFEKTQEYVDLQGELNYWSTRRAANVAERSSIRETIASTQEKINAARASYNASIDVQKKEFKENMNKELELSINEKAFVNLIDRAKFLLILIIGMVVMCEIGILYLNWLNGFKESSIEQYQEEKSLLIGLYEYLRVHKKNGKVSTQQVTFWNPKKLDWKQKTNFFYELVALGAITHLETVKFTKDGEEKSYKKGLLNEASDSVKERIEEYVINKQKYGF